MLPTRSHHHSRPGCLLAIRWRQTRGKRRKFTWKTAAMRNSLHPYNPYNRYYDEPATVRVPGSCQRKIARPVDSQGNGSGEDGVDPAFVAPVRWRACMAAGRWPVVARPAAPSVGSNAATCCRIRLAQSRSRRSPRWDRVLCAEPQHRTAAQQRSLVAVAADTDR